MSLLNKIKLNIKIPLVQNFISLGFLQFANYILPLITLPYLVRVLGPGKFGLLAFYQSFSQLFLVVIDYGFNYTATREISINRDDKTKVSMIFSSVLTIKFILTVFSVLFISALIFIFPSFKEDWSLIYATLAVVIFQSFFPRWFFQGYEEMKYITIITVIAKVLFTLLVFILVINQDDYIYVPILNSLGFFISVLISFYIIKTRFRVKFKIPTLSKMKIQLKDGWHLFLSSIASNLYTSLNSFILGIFTNESIVGYYAASEKIVKSIQDLFTPLFHSTYPYLSKKINEGDLNSNFFIAKLLKYVFISALFVSAIIFMFSSNIVYLLLGNKYYNSIFILRILAFIPLFGGLNIIINSLTLLSYNLKRQFSMIIISAGLFNIICSLIFVPYLEAVGSSIIMNLSEILILVSSILVLKRNRIELFPKLYQKTK